MIRRNLATKIFTRRSGKLIYFLTRAFRHAGVLKCSVPNLTQSSLMMDRTWEVLGSLMGLTHQACKSGMMLLNLEFSLHASGNLGDNTDLLSNSWSIPQPFRNAFGLLFGTCYGWTSSICCRNLTVFVCVFQVTHLGDTIV